MGLLVGPACLALMEEICQGQMNYFPRMAGQVVHVSVSVHVDRPCVVRLGLQKIETRFGSVGVYKQRGQTNVYKSQVRGVVCTIISVKRSEVTHNVDVKIARPTRCHCTNFCSTRRNSHTKCPRFNMYPQSRRVFLYRRRTGNHICDRIVR